MFILHSQQALASFSIRGKHYLQASALGKLLRAALVSAHPQQVQRMWWRTTRELLLLSYRSCLLLGSGELLFQLYSRKITLGVKPGRSKGTQEGFEKLLEATLAGHLSNWKTEQSRWEQAERFILLLGWFSREFSGIARQSFLSGMMGRAKARQWTFPKHQVPACFGRLSDPKVSTQERTSVASLISIKRAVNRNRHLTTNGCS